MGSPPNPTLYEIDTRAWLSELGRRLCLHAPLTLDRVPDAELDRLASLGFDWVWLMGVWSTGRAGREVSVSTPSWVAHYRDVLPDLRDDDVAGSVFAVREYQVSPRLGGVEGVRTLRDKLRRRGLKLMLDFVPNHTARDHPWVAARPEYYVHGSEADLAREPHNFARAATHRGDAVFAYGRDPYFPGWPDTFQLNYRHPALREAMTSEFVRVAGLCDGFRCDMAMLLLPEVFLATWGDLARPADGAPPVDSPFWPGAVARLRAQNPETFLLAEAYWDTEWRLQRQGFDATYDKRLCDRLRDRDAPGVRAHLHADAEFQSRSARFLENHDEPRAAAVFPPEVHRAAAIVTFLTPGLRLFHQGQLEGRKVRPSIHLGRRPVEPTDPPLAAFYGQLLAALARPEPRLGRWRLVECREGWAGNPTWDRFLAFGWDGPDAGRLLVVVNYGPTRGQCFVALPPEPGSIPSVRFRDLMSTEFYDRETGDLAARGLYLDLPPWGYHVFKVETSA